MNCHREAFWHSNTLRLQAAIAGACEGHAIEEGLNLSHGMFKSFEARPFLASADIHRLSKYLHLRGRHQAGVIVFVSGERQAVAFDRISNETNRPVVIDGIESGNDRS